MSKQFNEAARVKTDLSTVSSGWNHPDRATIYPGDIRNPWKTVYDFPMTAAKLATGQQLLLHCREDEVFDYVEQLNKLLDSPECLSRAYGLVEALEQQTRRKLAQLVRLEEQPLTDDEIPGLIAEIEETLATATEQTTADRLAGLLSPHNPAQEIVGLGKMLSRLRTVLAALANIKDQGFKVVVVDRRRQPKRPGLETGRNEPVGISRPPRIPPDVVGLCGCSG